MVTSKMLVEKWTPLIESEKARKVKNPEVMALVLENQENSLNEQASTGLGDIAQYTPILVPAVRRIFPNLLANEICGVQALNGPTGYAFALRFGYEGAGGKRNLTGTTGVGSVGNPNYPNASRSVQKNAQAFGGFAAVITTKTAGAGTPVAMIRDTNAQTITTPGSDVYLGATKIGTVAVYEPVTSGSAGKVLVDLDGVATHYFDNGAIYLANGSLVGTVAALNFGAVATSENWTVVAVFNNEAGYNMIFSSDAYFNYASTAASEYQKRNSMKSMKMSMEKFAVDVQSRKLKAEYSIELAQDLKAVHGMDAEAELINILEYEISAELDRELVEAIYANTTSAGTWTYGTAGVYAANNPSATAFNQFGAYGVADGRFEMEKFRTLYTRIVREANAVAIATRRGAANFIICSLNVASALECLSNFMYSAVPGNVETTIGVAKIGTLDGRFTVYLDTFAYDDFFVVGYKGNTAFDTGIIYCPYIPLMVQKITDPDTLQPVIGMQCRDAIVGNMWGAEKYYRKVTCSFAGSSLVQGNYYI
jgi:hypothetical protein